jgi:hypothetical protein
MRAAAIACMIAGLEPAALAAGNQPVTQPTRDVAVEYVALRGPGKIPGRSVRQHSWWHVADKRERVDVENVPSHLIEDGSAKVALLVRDSDRTYEQYKIGAGPFDGGATFKRVGSETVAGHECTDWEMVPQAGARTTPGQYCFTKDGVLLQVKQDGVVRVHATSVVYGATDPALFQVPPGYKRIGTTD